MTTHETPEHPDVGLILKDRQALALFRACLEYKNLLRFSLMQGQDDIIETELRCIEAVTEQISLAAYYPERIFGAQQDG